VIKEMTDYLGLTPAMLFVMASSQNCSRESPILHKALFNLWGLSARYHRKALWLPFPIASLLAIDSKNVNFLAGLWNHFTKWPSHICQFCMVSSSHI